MVKISIIVPVYNVEKFLQRSLQSIIKQSFREIQIILVNDGSSDGSLKICEEYKEIDDRILLIDSPNLGVSNARNLGISASVGKYIGFVDPDDYIEPDMFENLYNLMEKNNTDVGICGYSIIKENINQTNDLSYLNADKLDNTLIDNKLIQKIIGPNKVYEYNDMIMASVWRLIINREFLVKKGIFFEKNLYMMEDLVFTTHLLLEANSVLIEKNNYYNYCIHNTSVTQKFNANLKENQMFAIRNLYILLKKYDKYEKFSERLNNRYINTLVSIIVNESSSYNNNNNLYKKIMNIKDICKDSRLVKILDNINVKDLKLSQRVLHYSLKYKLAVFLYFYYRYIKSLRWFLYEKE